MQRKELVIALLQEVLHHHSALVALGGTMKLHEESTSKDSLSLRNQPVPFLFEMTWI